MKLRFIPLVAVALLPACTRDNMVTETGIYVTRSTCPIPGVLAGTGDITLFNPPSSRDAVAIDVTATISNVRATCQDVGDHVVSTISFTVTGNRRDAGAARQVVLPFFNVAVRGGSEISAKRVGQVALNFAPGGNKAWTTSQATIRVHRSAVALPDNVRRILTRKRRAGDADAATDPLADPGVRAAVAAATFEQLIGFHLTQDQIRYNVTR